ncbi:MAG: PKD domain-containing protein [Candidatus Gracilibacteria bacterium]
MKKSFHALLVLTLMTLLAPQAFAVGGDLAINASNIKFSTTGYIQGTNTRIWITVQNNSEYDLLGSVRITANGEAVAGDQPVSVLGNKTDDVFIDWVPSKIGTYDLVINIMPWESQGDDTSNNTVIQQVYVEQDTDRDGIPDSRDDDKDGDSVKNAEDAFPDDPSEWKDTDGDGNGNNIDTDDDNDGVLDTEDELPEDPLHSKDMDKDGIADEEDDDIDGDGLLNGEEDDIGTDPLLVDTDNDHVGDKEDPFPLDPKEWSDMDSDGIGDNTDTDIDGDGVLNQEDIDPSNQAPTANVNDKIILAGLDSEVIFDASTSTDDGEITKYVWQIGDETLEGQVVKKTFDSKGLQIATLTVYDQNGQSDSIEVRVRVYDFKFLMEASAFSLLLILLAFYIIYRYNRAAPKKKTKKASSKL